LHALHFQSTQRGTFISHFYYTLSRLDSDDRRVYLICCLLFSILRSGTLFYLVCNLHPCSRSRNISPSLSSFLPHFFFPAILLILRSFFSVEFPSYYFPSCSAFLDEDFFVNYFGPELANFASYLRPIDWLIYCSIIICNFIVLLIFCFHYH